MEDEQAHVTYGDDQFDLDIRVKMTTREVDRFVIQDTHSCASTCGDECTNSCASTCAGSCPVLDTPNETETCETCGSCTSECDRSFYEDHYVLEVSQVRADGVTRRVAGEHVIRRVVEHPPQEG